MNTWLSVDTTTSGPINAYPLMWPFPFGADTGFAVARITATFLIGATWFFLWTALASASAFVRVWTSACLILFMGGTQFPDFIHYSSEIVPSFLLMGAMAVAMVAVESKPNLAQIFIAGVCLGLVPFAKLQAAIIAATLGAILLWLVARQAKQPYRSALLLISSTCLPAVVLLLPLAIDGGLPDFWMSYILAAKYYVSVSGWGKVESSRIWPAQLRALHYILSGNLSGGYVATFAGAASLAIVALPIREIMRNAPAQRMLSTHPDAVRTAIVFLVLVVSVCAVMVPSRPFPHYALLFIWPLTLLAGLAWSLAGCWPAPGEGRRWEPAKIVGALSIACIGGLALQEAKLDYDPEVTGAESVFAASQLMVSPATGRGRMLIWGFMPQWYVWSGWMPATRDIVTYNQSLPTPIRRYFRDRMMAELRKSPPDYIIDAVAPGSFVLLNDPEKEGLASFPELAAFVANEYVLLSPASSGVSRPRVFARKAMVALIEKRYAIPSRIYASSALDADTVTASASRVADGLVFESSSDAWLLPDGKLGQITMELADAQAIGAIEILNTRGGQRGNRAGKTASVLAYEGGNLAFDKKVQLLRFPYWTEITIPDTISSIDSVVVRIESYVGVGGGLNEIRLRKRSPRRNRRRGQLAR
jgi:hypothetical protein